MASQKVFAHIVTFNSASYLAACLDALLALEKFSLGGNLHIEVTDNASADDSFAVASRFKEKGISIYRNESNLGFCGAHNQGLKRFLDGDCEYFLCLNPDVALNADALAKMVEGMCSSDTIGSACPLLLRAGADLRPLSPPMMDAAGMYVSPSLRHFDRGSGRSDIENFKKRCLVFGASGACLLMRRSFVADAEVNAGEHEADVDVIYPQLARTREQRHLLFDEAFFAYREDADLAWRGQALGWDCIFIPEAVGYHVRLVTPERRQKLPPEINLFGVRNRFLLQINNYYLAQGLAAFFTGYLLRNLTVIAGCIFFERKSLAAFPQLIKLWRRGLARRNLVAKRAKRRPNALAKWFAVAPYCEDQK